MIIEVAGIDGSGKSTVIAHLMGFFSKNDVPCYERVLRSTYKRILADLAHNAGHEHWRHLFPVEEVELAQALEMGTLMATTVQPMDHSYQVVVTDTYVRRWLATAHMWGARNLDRLAMVYSRLPAPDLSFHLEVDPAVAYRRLTARPKQDHLVKLGHPGRVATYAESFAATKDLVPYRPYVLSNSGDIEEAVEEMLDVVRRWDESGAGLIGAAARAKAERA
jgi:thymidylate kinase